jgi:hypothetical protein
MGPLTVVGLPRGQARHLESFEVERLKQACTSRAKTTGFQRQTKKVQPEMQTKKKSIHREHRPRQ